ncbi:MAG: helix-turn-helix transcriptional regulator [Thermodesulfovibrionia bacterium]|nr:helix-turn-helix transcriptional regulator [Thermodesulfovibrionia bacterium]
MKQYLKGPHRRRHILRHALVIAAEHGYTNISQRAVAQAAGVASGLVPHYFTTMAGLRKAIMREAVRVEHLGIIAQGIVLKDQVALAAPMELKERVAAWVFA